MSNKLIGWDDTIVALATVPAVSAIGVVRISGKDSFRIVDVLFPSKDLNSQDSHTLHVGMLREGVDAIDEVVLSLFCGPKSYTGEDVVEISGHGSPFVLQKIIDACVRNGARVARPGEFTQRAFLNGKLDLTQAESVADLIVSNTEASQRTALQNMKGGFSQQLKHMREQLIQFASLIELELDFATEDVEFADRGRFIALIQEIEKITLQLISSFQLGNVIKNGVSVAIIGKPNAGKSTLLNCLLNEDRAIVSEIAGTTRDTIEEVLNINGILFRLIDTAGIRDGSEDRIENMGIEKSLEKMRSADLVLYVYDVELETEEKLLEQKKQFDTLGLNYVLVANKSDKIALDGDNQYSNQIKISAKLQQGIGELKQLIYQNAVSGKVHDDQTIITNARHLASLQEVYKYVLLILKGLKENLPGDLLAIEIRSCLFHLGDITGEVTTEDKLDYIFSKFCIGK